jgi:DNA-binding XRE family transcriptional regulator
LTQVGVDQESDTNGTAEMAELFYKESDTFSPVDTFSPRSTPISDAAVRRHFILSSFDYYITVHEMQLTSIRELAAVIKDRRRIKGWSQAALAERVGVSRDWIINLEKAKPTIELGLVFRALKALDLSLALAPEQECAKNPRTR